MLSSCPGGGEEAVLCLFPYGADSQAVTQGQKRQIPDDAHSPSMAVPTLVHNFGEPFSGGANQSAITPGPDLSGVWPLTSPEPRIPPPHGVEALWLSELE